MFKSQSHLRCSNCGNSLSIFPIHYEDESKSFTCGRCPLMQISIVKQIRQTAYEELAQFASFPCKFKEQGCMEYHVPSALIKHENLCGFRTYFCPLLSPEECDWIGPHHLLYNHYLKNHKNFTTENLDVKIHLNQSWEKRYIFWCDTKPFLAHFRHHSGQHTFYLCLKHLEPFEEEEEGSGESYVYKIFLYNNKKQLYEYPTRPVQTDVTDNADCIHIFIKSWKLQKKSCILVTIKVFKTKNANDETPATENMQDLLRKIECSACFNHMLPPITQCLTGHSLCTKCSQVNNVCPTCQEAIGNTRNFILEEFTRLIKYPCKYQEDGCSFITTWNESKDHEKSCRHRSFACPIKNCHSKNQVSKLTKHLRTNHPNELFYNLLSNSSITFKFIRGVQNSVTSIASAYGVNFRLYFLYDGATFFWSMQTVNAAESSCQYVFELHIVNNSGEKFHVHKNCSPFTEIDQALTEGNSYIRLDESSIKGMIKDNQLIYSIKIMKQMRSK